MVTVRSSPSSICCANIIWRDNDGFNLICMHAPNTMLIYMLHYNHIKRAICLTCLFVLYAMPPSRFSPRLQMEHFAIDTLPMCAIANCDIMQFLLFNFPALRALVTYLFASAVLLLSSMCGTTFTDVCECVCVNRIQFQRHMNRFADYIIDDIFRFGNCRIRIDR